MLRLSFANVREGLTEGGRGLCRLTWRRMGANLVVVELATAVVLLVGAGVAGQELLQRCCMWTLGFEPEHLATVGVMAPDVDYEKDEQIVPVARKILDDAAAMPGVQSVAITIAVAGTSQRQHHLDAHRRPAISWRTQRGERARCECQTSLKPLRRDC